MLRGEVTVNLGTATTSPNKKAESPLDGAHAAICGNSAVFTSGYVLQRLRSFERPVAFRPSLTRGLALIYVSWKKIGTGGVFYAQMMAVNEKANGRNVGAFGFY